MILTVLSSSDNFLLYLVLILLLGLGLLALLLWLSTKFPIIQYLFMFGFSLTMMIICFMGPSEDTTSVDAWLVESLFFTGFLIFLAADICFDREYYLDTKFEKGILSDDYYATTKLASQSTFWGTLGSCIVSSLMILGVIHLCCGDNVSLAMTICGWVGVICCVASLVLFGKFIYYYVEAKRSYDDDY